MSNHLPEIRLRQRGVSLISLMIALSIASVLLAGLFAIWFQTRTTFKAQAALAQLEDNERMALTVIANSVQTGGYLPYYLNFSTIPPNTPYSRANNFIGQGSFAAGQTIAGTSGTGTNSDTLSIRFVADQTNPGNTLDCQGQSDATGTLVTNQFQVGTDGNLQCSLDGGVTFQDIVSGISNMKVLYGVDTATCPQTSTGSTTQYIQASAMTAVNWSCIRSVNVQLTFVNPLYPQAGQPATLPPIQRVIAVTQTSL